MTRHLDLEGIENFRDFGGYETVCGRGLKRGQLYRSANHSGATPADLEVLKALGISVIVDLRRPLERGREPSRRWDGFSGQVVENHEEHVNEDWSVLLKQAETLDGDWFRKDSLNFYHNLPYEARHIDLFSRYFRALGETDGAILVHCAAGKDRTGMICALTHHLAGVHPHDVVTDYLATNIEGRIQSRVRFLDSYIQDLTGLKIDESALRVAVSVHESYLDRAFRRIVDTSGSIDGYLQDVLGIDAVLRSRIEARLLG